MVLSLLCGEQEIPCKYKEKEAKHTCSRLYFRGTRYARFESLSETEMESSLESCTNGHLNNGPVGPSVAVLQKNCYILFFILKRPSGSFQGPKLQDSQSCNRSSILLPSTSSSLPPPGRFFCTSPSTSC